VRRLLSRSSIAAVSGTAPLLAHLDRTPGHQAPLAAYAAQSETSGRGDLIEDLPEDAFPGEDSGEVLLEMLVGSITPAAVAAGPRAVAQTVALLGAVGDRTLDDLRAAAALAASDPGRNYPDA
jgi:hypothetical protein